MLSADEALLMEKLESPYGVDAVPTGAANAMLTSNLSIEPLAGDNVTRDLDGPFSGADPVIITGRHVGFSFDIELAASGTSGAGITAPAWGPSLQACGFDQVVDTTPAAEKVTFTPSALSGVGAVASVSSYINMSGQRHVVLGSRGGWALELGDGLPMFKIQRKGLFVAPTSVTFPTADFTAFRAPLAVDNDNTQTITLDGYACKLFGLSIDSGITPEIINIPGNESVEVLRREITGKITIAAPDIGTEKDFFSQIAAHAFVPFNIVHGTTPGDIVEIAAPAIQLLNPTYGDSQNIRTLSMDMRFTATSAGNDEIVITTR